MMEKILCVDDEANVLSAYQRQLRKLFDVGIAEGGEQALAAVDSKGPYAVILSDLRMPGMDGIAFLTKARERAPDTVRIMLTGYADVATAVNAVNEGNIFRLLTKPCPPEALVAALEAGIRQYRLVNAERELLERTLAGSVKVLTEVLSLVSPISFGKAARVRKIMAKLAVQLEVKSAWEFELAGMLSQIGCVTVPNQVLEKVYQGETLTTVESAMFCAHPQVGQDLIANIPRLEGLAEIIAYQEKNYSGTGIPADDRKGEGIPLGARALHVALKFDTLVTSGLEPRAAFEKLQSEGNLNDPAVLAALAKIIKVDLRYESRSVLVRELLPRMVLGEDVQTFDGVLLVAKGQEVTSSMRTRLKNFADTTRIKEPIRVLVPLRE
jgi:response regulator RpfG family c-di-GMP phosphodiesterase